MRRFGTALSALMLAGIMAGAAHAAQKPKAPPRPILKEEKAKRQEPVKRQNFRARRPDEIAPWEGFEDCAFGVPCVGPTFNPRWN